MVMVLNVLLWEFSVGSALPDALEEDHDGPAKAGLARNRLVS